jgi:hypothetical protein
MLLSKHVARPIREIIMLRWTSGTKKQGQLRVNVRCKRERTIFVKIIYIVVIVCFLPLHTSYTRNRGTCVTPQNMTRWRMT